MDISDLVANLLYFLIGSGVFSILIWYIIKMWFDKDMEKYKVKLQRETIRYSKLYEQRADILKEIYYKFFDFEQAMGSFLSPMQMAGDPSMEEKRKITAEAGNEFRDYYKRHKIYLSEKVSIILEDIDKIFTESWMDFTTFEVYDPESTTLKSTDKMNKWVGAWDKIRLNIPNLKNQLEKEFRELLGVNNN